MTNTLTGTLIRNEDAIQAISDSLGGKPENIGPDSSLEELGIGILDFEDIIFRLGQEPTDYAGGDRKLNNYAKEILQGLTLKLEGLRDEKHYLKLAKCNTVEEFKNKARVIDLVYTHNYEVTHKR
tara:strand:- start:927 stop:1301 length:375 start_codon:yes stop_codon:yes gene_type:complete